MAEIDPLQELELRQELARRMGGAEGIARQRARGKLHRARAHRRCSPTPARSASSAASSARRATTASALADFTPKGRGRRHVHDRRPQGGRDRRRLHRARRLGRRRRRRARRRSCAPASGRSSGASRYVRLLDAAGGSVRSLRGARPHLPARRQRLVTAVDVELLACVPVVSAVMGSVAGLPAVQRLHGALQRDGARHRPGLPRRPAGGEGGARLRHHQGGARRRPHPRPRQRRRRQPRRRPRRTRSPRSAASSRTCRRNVCELPPRGAEPTTADRRADDAARRRSRATAASRSTPTPILDAVVDEGSFFEIAPRLRPAAHHRPGPGRRLSGRHHGQQPEPLRRRHRRRGRREGHPPDPAVRHCSTCR